MFPRILLAVALLGAVSVAPSCKKGPVENFGDLTNDPRANFTAGVRTLEKPDRSGVVDYAAAYAYFRDSANLGGGPKADFNAGWVAEILDRPVDAEAHYAKAYAADPSYAAAMHSYARLLIENGNGTQAAEVYKAYIAAHPTDLAVRNDLVSALAAAKLYDEALAQAREILMIDANNATVFASLATMYQDQGNYPMSLLCSERAQALDAKSGSAHNNMAITYLALGEEQAAIDELKKALEVDPTNFEANVNLGYIALNSGDYPRALATLEAAATARPHDVVAKAGLAVAYRGMKDYEKADDLYKELTLADPTDATLFFNAASLHEVYTRDFDKAIGYLEAFTERNTVGADHEVYERIERVKATKAEEEARQAEEAARLKEEEERKRRNEELLASMGEKVKVFQAKVEANRACLGPIADEADMMVEQANMVIESQDASMAPDMQQMLDEYYGPMVDEAIVAQCGGTPPPAPADEGTETP